MSKRKFFKTTFMVSVLSDDKPVPMDADLDTIHYMITDGDCVGTIEVAATAELTGKEAADALKAAGSTPDFFQLNDDGTEQDNDGQTGIVHKELSKEEAGVHCIDCGVILLAGQRVAEDEDGNYRHEGTCPKPDMRNLPVRACSIVNINNPEWGVWGVMEDFGAFYAIRGDSGDRILYKDEAERLWRLSLWSEGGTPS
jgi:hypothetical protein